nr:SasC_Mrp_aggreg: SasC/Mrp/FmtB intercellular aggregation [uncultured bacterium]
MSGNLISKGVVKIPHRITNIRLTFLGIKKLQT